ncbi:hypothetical protein [Actinomadura latina]|uniref:Uncharacterized protein n=1 Tax=Actinomadura latina TaxID=163603 RepID=A0A846Z8C9_9ACTN|nr:hypothetical protein [Actinomadura latina]NKZ06918.1 hypothetical protein [Actinomadura latina]
MTTIESSGTTAAPAFSAVPTARRVAAIGSVLAAFIHYAVVPEHVNEWWAYGVFFSAVGMFQLVWAVLAYTGKERPLLLSGLAVNLGVLALWVVSRTAGLPFGPESGEAEAVGVLDVLSGVAELALVGGILLALRRSRPKPERSGAERSGAAAEESAERSG